MRMEGKSCPALVLEGNRRGVSGRGEATRCANDRGDGNGFRLFPGAAATVCRSNASRKWKGKEIENATHDAIVRHRGDAGGPRYGLVPAHGRGAVGAARHQPHGDAP